MKNDIKLAQLMEWARRSGTKLSIELCLYIIDEVCKLVELFHGEGTVQGERRAAVHRSLTPENIVITPEGLVKVLGFGAGEDLSLRGDASPETIELRVMYLSPEQASGIQIDERVEVYSAAAILYELLTETPVFPPEQKLASMLGRIQEGSIRKPSRSNSGVAGYLEQVLLRALQKDRSQRYQSASEFAFAIERILSRFSTANLRDKLVMVLDSLSTQSRLGKSAAAGAALGRKVEIMGTHEPVTQERRKPDSLRLHEVADERVSRSPFHPSRVPRWNLVGGAPVRRLLLLALLLGVFSLSHLDSLEAALGKSVGLSSVASTVRTSAGHISQFCRKKVLASMP